MKNKILILLISILIISSYPIYGAGEIKISGTIEALNFKENKVTILDYDGKTHVVKIGLNTQLKIEGLKKQLTDFYFGQEVDIEHKNNTALKVVGYEEEDPTRDGYIMAGSRFKRGQVLFISKDQIELKVNQERVKYRITPNTIYFKEGKIVNVNQIKEGDKVLLNFDSIYTSEVASVKIEDAEQIISGILKGKIELVDERNKEILLKSPYIYKEGKWLPYEKDKVSLKTGAGRFYTGAESIPLKTLKAFKDKEVYVAYDKSFGRMTVSKLTTKNGLAQEYQAKVSNIEYTTGQMVVDNNLMHFTEGTIVIKDNRIVDSLNINKNKDVMVTVDSIHGKKNTSLVSMTSSILDDRVDESKISIYRGKLEDIFDYEIEIGKINYRLDYLKLTDQIWKQVKDSQRFSMSEDTLIYDSELKEEIDVGHFVSSRYTDLTDIKNQTLKDRLAKNYYKNKVAYFVVRESEYEKEVLSINLTPDKQLYGQNVQLTHSTQGEIKEIDYDKGTITLTKVKNYNTLNNRFENAPDQTINMNKSVILLNDLPISKDKTYSIRKGSKIYAIKEKTSSRDESYILLIED